MDALQRRRLRLPPRVEIAADPAVGVGRRQAAQALVDARARRRQPRQRHRGRRGCGLAGSLRRARSLARPGRRALWRSPALPGRCSRKSSPSRRRTALRRSADPSGGRRRGGGCRSRLRPGSPHGPSTRIRRSSPWPRSPSRLSSSAALTPPLQPGLQQYTTTGTPDRSSAARAVGDLARRHVDRTGGVALRPRLGAARVEQDEVLSRPAGRRTRPRHPSRSAAGGGRTPPPQRPASRRAGRPRRGRRAWAVSGPTRCRERRSHTPSRRNATARDVSAAAVTPSRDFRQNDGCLGRRVGGPRHPCQGGQSLGLLVPLGLAVIAAALGHHHVRGPVAGLGDLDLLLRHGVGEPGALVGGLDLAGLFGARCDRASAAGAPRRPRAPPP